MKRYLRGNEEVMKRYLRMKKLRILFFTLLILVLGTVFASAAEFPDVPQNSWFYTYVDELSDLGIIKGMGGGYFEPYSNVTHAQALKLVLETAGKEIPETVTPGAADYMWYSNIVNAADELGLAESGTYEPNDFATREEVCSYIVKGMNWETASHPQDVFIDTESDNAEILYQKDIVTGVAGGEGYSFKGDSNISRAEAATLIYRMSHYDPLETKQLINIEDAEGFRYQNPVEVSDWEKIYLYMGRNNLTEYTVIYPASFKIESEDMADQICQNAVDAYSSVYEKYNEYFCYWLSTSIRTNYVRNNFVATIKITNPDFDDDEIRHMQSEAFELTDDAVNELIAKNKIKADMTEKEKAKVLYDYICKICEYDENGKSDTRYLGYGAITDGKVVCQGYTALMNTMLKSVGIWCETVPGKVKDRRGTENHIWTRAMIDGEILYIDVTYGDTSIAAPEISNDEYFCVSKEKLQILSSGRIWDEDEVK